MKLIALILFSIISTALLFTLYLYMLGDLVDRVAQDFSHGYIQITE